MSMGDRIHSLRNDLGLTLQELGDKVGVGASTVRKWETGYIKTLRVDKVAKLAAALQTTEKYLMGWEEAGASTDPSDDEAELLRIASKLDVKKRHKLLAYAWSLEDEL